MGILTPNKISPQPQTGSSHSQNQTTTQSSPTGHDAVALAAELLENAKLIQTSKEKSQAHKIAGMMEDPNGKNFTMALSDQAFRSHKPARIANQVQHLLHSYGVPKYFQWWERAALWLGGEVGPYLPQIVVPAMIAKLRQETQNVILPSEEKQFKGYLAKRRAGGTRLNINQLGEAILGEEEAGRRLDAYLELLSRPDVEYISVKISSIFSQINLVSFDHTVEEIKTRLRTLYRTAMSHQYVHPDGRELPKFVNLDMEEYRDLHLTVEAFQQVLDEPEFMTYRAGIVLQAYLPDSHMVQKQLTQWAINRFNNGGAPIKVRIVKGANLAMEKVEAALHGWEQAPYYTKADVDANFKRMVGYACRPEHAPAVNLGLASHNLFDVAYGLLLQDHFDVSDHVEFEMLEGMANHQARTVQERAGGLLLYAPVVKQSDFHSAISYLVRRLDENTAEENFLHDLFGLEVDTPQWHKQRGLFLTALNRKDEIAVQPNRQQDRNNESWRSESSQPFENIADTDWSLRQNQAWIKEVRDQWASALIEDIPLQINGVEYPPSAERVGEGHDPSRPHHVAYRYALATAEQIDLAVTTARHAQPNWQATPIEERKRILIACGDELARRRGELMGVMMLDGGKQPQQADPEISEGIDFAHYYARSFDNLQNELATHQFSAHGIVLVTPPWNFPFAIPTGGVISSLMAGNTVIFKPAPEAVLVGWHMVNALWAAGVPKDVLQFVPTTDDEVGRGLVTDDRVDAVILTGAYETARLFQSWKPNLRLMAETSGKNSLIITGLADHDQAIKDLVYSAFGHAGQKCSAASLGLLEAEVYDNPSFMRQLRDAAASLAVGSAWDLTTIVNPLIREPGADLLRALTTLDDGESWLLEPQMIDGNPNLWSPGIKLGIKPGSFYHKTECFGPVLGLMRFETLDEAVNLVNSSQFGLTSGLHSLDSREIAFWRDTIEAGNLYINRGTTGAIVQRQPFGGWKKSVFGNAKAGGPNYVASLGQWRPNDPLTTADQNSYAEDWHSHFAREHDPSQILGESNIFRYRPIEHCLVRIDNEDAANMVKVEYIQKAAAQCGVQLTISANTMVSLPNHIPAVYENDDQFCQRIASTPYGRIRAIEPLTSAMHAAANDAHVQVIDAPVSASGRLELRHYLHEQSVTETTHRYGNILK